jgi:hypothetical protein
MNITIGAVAVLLSVWGSPVQGSDTVFSPEATFSNVVSYLTVDLVERKAGEQVYHHLPAPFPQDIGGSFLVAGQYLFQKERVRNGTQPLMKEAFLNLIKTCDPNAKWPVLRCPPNRVLAVVLLDSRGMITGLVIFDVCNDAITLENAKGEGKNYRFGSGDTHIAPLIKMVEPELKY